MTRCLRSRSPFVVATFFVSAPVIVVDGLLFGAARDNVVVKLAPPAVAFGIDEDDVVAAVIVSAVHQYGMQSVGGWR